MSGIVNKIKEAVHGDKHSAPEGSHGPHNTRAANAADPRVDSDRDGSHHVGTGTHTGTHTSGLTGTSGTHTGAGRVAGHGEYGSSNPFSSTTGTHGTSEGAHGPHSSRIANAADPRVDSDRDGSKTVGGTGLGTGVGHTGTHANPLSSNTHGTAEGTHGPHSSRIANAADPRVDSDRDGSRTAGGMGMGSGMGHTGSSGLHSTGTGTTGFGSSNTHHAHAGTGVTGMTGTHGAPAGTYGPHGSRVANAADPRVDSDRDGRGAIHSGPGPAGNTAGPHKSDMLNKMDPRVDSDLDGSKTVGQNKTYQQQ
jgi:hypothetical protein